MNQTRLRNVGIAFLIVAVVAALYGPFLRNPIVFDDIGFFLRNSAGEQPVSAYHFDWLQLRSLPYATLAWTKAWLGLDLIYFRIVNLLLHAAVCCALYFFLVALWGALYPRADEAPDAAQRTSHQSMALFAALLLAVHPVATYAAGYLVQRTTLFATLFCLLAMGVWVWGSAKRHMGYLWAAVPLYYGAVFSKEHAVMLCAVLPLLTVLLHADWRRRLRQQAGVHLALWAIAVFALLAHKGILGSVYEVRADAMLQQSGVEHRYLFSIVTQMALYFHYLLLWLLPHPGALSIDMRAPFAQSLSPFYGLAVVGFLAWGALGLWLLFRRKHASLLGFSMLFPWLMFLTELSTVRIQEVFVLYRSYLWVVGALCAMPWVLQRFRTRQLVALGLPCLLALYVLSLQSLATMAHPILLWEKAKQVLAGRNDLPGASRIYYNLGIQYFRADRLDQAIPEFKQALALSPTFIEAYNYLGVAYAKAGDWQAAVKTLTQAMDLAAQTSPALAASYRIARAQAFESGGDAQSAQADYRESCRLLQTGCDQVR